MPTVSYGISNTANDVADVAGFGIFDTTVANGTQTGFDFAAGLRFLGVAVPQGATIDSATLTLKKDAPNSIAGSWGVLKGVAADNAPAWTTTGPSSASKTTQSVSIVDGATQNYDVAAIVQAIVNRSGWASGNALAFAGDPTGTTGLMAWIDYSVSTTNCAQLSITYSTGGGTAYTLTASSGSFSLTGQAANLKRGRRLVAAAAAFVLTGQAVTLTKGRRIQANAATFSLGGQNVGLRAARRITGGAGSYALNGQNATLKATRRIAAGAGSYTLTGQSASFDISKKMAAQAGAFMLTGRAAGLIYARRLKADAGSFVLSGRDAQLTFVRALQAGAGSFSLTGQDAALKYARRMPAEPGSYVLTGMDANLIADQGGNITLTAETGVFVFTGGEATFRITGWSPVPPTSETWTPVPPSSETWTPVGRNPTVWS